MVTEVYGKLNSVSADQPYHFSIHKYGHFPINSNVFFHVGLKKKAAVDQNTALGVLYLVSDYQSISYCSFIKP